MSFGLGAFLDWRQLAFVCAGAPLMLFLSARCIPETPSFLLYSQQEEKAAEALFWLRGEEDPVAMQEELDNIAANVRRIRQEEKAVSGQCRRGASFFKPLALVCGLMFFNR